MKICTRKKNLNLIAHIHKILTYILKLIKIKQLFSDSVNLYLPLILISVNAGYMSCYLLEIQVVHQFFLAAGV